ncbi:MAG: tetraacyldisaccharide 4'-kinase [Caulobacterales bacterium]
MRAPEFWSGDAEGRDRAPILQALLAPISVIYAASVAHRLRTMQPARASIPVICVGNLTLGGAGKTPVTRALRAKLGIGAHVLSRGYGGSEAGPMRVTEEMSADHVGDEPLLHARDGATWIARDRAAGAEYAARNGARLLLLDDGFQNPALAKDLSIVVIDAGALFGNGKVFPAGPLREPLAAGLARADGLILLHAQQEAFETPALLANFSGPILHAHLEPLAPPPQGPLVAFTGIARPDKFFDTLRAAGGDIAEAIPYPDHHRFTESEMTWLRTLARERNGRLITTEKDFVRLPAAARADIECLPVTAHFQDEGALDALIAPFAARAEARA